MTDTAQIKARRPGPVRVHAMTIGLEVGEEPSEWFAACIACNWYGDYRMTKSLAKSDAARHRRAHEATR